MSDTEHLAQMANDIANFFRAQGSRDEAIAGIANHINSFWTRRMRDTLIEHTERGDEGLDELPRAALRRLKEQGDSKPDQPLGGDAG
jgi:formate dehydrogenase subunit delta